MAGAVKHTVPSRAVSSWGNVLRAEHPIYGLRSRHDRFPKIPAGGAVLPFGNGRSYGDSCLNVGGALIETRKLDRFIRFDRDEGVLTCEAGVLLADILRLAVPAGWFLPVVPGTGFATLGGAIANDVHGKNHHRAGTFGCHVRRFELLRSDGTRRLCSPNENAPWFAATIGGLGLTGVVTWAEVKLRQIASEQVNVERVRFANLKQFFALCEESEGEFEYTVAWIDCLGRGRSLGRGVMQRANHGTERASDPTARRPRQPRRLRVPFTAPVPLVNAATLRLVNTLIYRWQRSASAARSEHYETFCFPLDRVLDWNRLYGPRGFYQYQCVVPSEDGADTTRQLLEAIAFSGQGSFLAVLKRFGDVRSPGLLSFPREGITLALDFPNRGPRVRRLFDELDAIVGSAGGRLYPAKDARMPGALFRSGYPLWREFAQFIDPACSSSFWRRVTEHA